ncbi:MAG TPA: hypothetical protein VJJ46_10605, partial [Anaerolineales bacterium]|nr:hypothetical protein [Anaerolineales bacterium]
LVYFEETSDIRTAIHREKQLKGWVRRKKVALVESVNPGWKDLSDACPGGLTSCLSCHPEAVADGVRPSDRLGGRRISLPRRAGSAGRRRA